ncbi:MAG: hypothetical protein GF329_03390 [Candidatus Lokiarchaeota archaeon]|nr:hypothetical protein [Candidatus Lokiarchaeota archaeon]
MRYKVLMFTCYGGCETGVSASKALIRIWEENPDNVKIGCLPAVIIPWKRNTILRNSEKRILIDACGIQCGKKLIEKERMPIDGYIELTSTLNRKKKKKFPTKSLEEKVYELIKKEVEKLLND